MSSYDVKGDNMSINSEVSYKFDKEKAIGMIVNLIMSDYCTHCELTAKNRELNIKFIKE